MSNFEMINLSVDQVIFKDEAGRWKLENAGVLYNLVSASDFKRIISLLEVPMDRAKMALGPDFPYMSVAEIGLGHDSDYWINLALSWVAGSPAKEVAHFVEDLKKLVEDKAVSQTNRQMAKNELKRLLDS
jgi:hypothetical protein